MKTVLFSLFQFFLASICFAQYVGIGVAEPQNKLHVVGNLLVNEVLVKNQAAPTGAQTKTMVNAGTVTFAQTDSTGYIYDPGGPAGDYLGNATAYADVYIAAARGFELNFEDIQLGTGDSIIILEGKFSTNPPWYAVGNGFSTPGKITITGPFFYLIFKSNVDGANGRGFRLHFRSLYADSTQGEVKGFTSTALYFEPKTGSLRFGLLNNSVQGFGSMGAGLFPKASAIYSTALGYFPNATGNYSVSLGGANLAEGSASIALGFGTYATGDYSTSMGSGSTASGQASTAMGADTKAEAFGATSMGVNSTAAASGATATGNGTTASGINSFVAGTSSLASGNNSVAMGTQVTANGINSTALGNYVSTGGYNGAFIIGDNSTTSVLSPGGANTFRARFVSGYALFTGLNPSIGVVLNGGGNSWSAFSDMRLKENFLSVNGEDILRRISKLPLSTWNYIGQDRKTFRHYGPMAQDFYEAFGHDAIGEIGCDTLINQQDFLGVNLIGIQALEKRTAEQKEQILRLNSQVEMLKEQNEKLISLIKELRLGLEQSHRY